MADDLTQEEVYGKYSLLAWVQAFVIGVCPPLVALYVIYHYPLEDCYNPVFYKMIICVYLLFLVLSFLFRKRLMPYWRKLPKLFYMLAIISFPLPVVFSSWAAFGFFNAYLDSSEPYRVSYSVLVKYPNVHSLLVQKEGQEKRLLLADLPITFYSLSKPGGAVELSLGQGYFHQPWIRDYVVEAQSK